MMPSLDDDRDDIGLPNGPLHFVSAQPPEPVTVGSWEVDETVPLGAAIAEVLDTPWYVALFFVALGGLIVFVILAGLLVIWNS